MDIRQLTYFVEVARQGSFTQASLTLHVTQPTISKMVRNLEEELGVTLFDRSQKKIHLTDVGEVVYARSLDILQSLHNLHSALDDVRQIQTGTLRIGLPPMVGAPFFASLLADFHQRYPHVRIQLEEHGGKRVEQLVEEGSLDFGATVLPVDTDVFDIHPFYNEELKLLVPAGHRLAGRERVQFGELRDDSFLMFSEEFSLHDRIHDACRIAGFQPQVVCQSSQWDLLRQMVAAGLGVALLPEILYRDAPTDSIRVLGVEHPRLHWNLAVIWRKERYLSFAARAWLSFLQERLTKV
ncbi:LysR family transcriptional regulator [Tumebacillus flagellatus]|uniref:LysR family transcriptional regulator n=1 Tax=Tumebacillus flagellatus TaxID=1157490 RepID=A0A074LTV1_9BACL|nr:LysR family transcriptional regulator [Tumebacillus flagellatus]KEO83253.1 LysR family transcriptional regulator [Tumebacillus flagellatus]